jgi:hypothetical protein
MIGEITEDKTILPNQTQTLPIIENITQQTLIAPQVKTKDSFCYL